jgi:6-pyruvoyltetrahydropterin/6-carboxytetrahydropterin synthase
VFAASELDENNWVVDFGDLNELEKWLREHFDHKTAVAFDDPHMDIYLDLQDEGIIDLVGVEGTGCEMFAKMAHDFASNLMFEKYKDRCWVESVEVREHGANSAIYRGGE